MFFVLQGKYEVFKILFYCMSADDHLVNEYYLTLPQLHRHILYVREYINNCRKTLHVTIHLLTVQFLILSKY